MVEPVRKEPVVTMTAAEKAAADKIVADAKAAKIAHDKGVQREKDERTHTKAHLLDILILRGLAQAFSPHGSEDLATALAGIANALASGRKLDENTLVEVAILLKNEGRDWGKMVKKINEVMQPDALPDRSVVGILDAVKRGGVTIEQAQGLLNTAQNVTHAVIPKTPGTEDVNV